MTASERAAPGRRARLQVPGLRSHPGRWVWVRSGWRARRGRTGEAPGQPPSRAPRLARRLLTGRAWPEGAACEGPRLPSLLQTFREGLFPVADRAGGVVSTPLRLGALIVGMEKPGLHKAPESTWGLECRQTVLPLCTQVPAPNLDPVTHVERLHSKYQTKDVQCGVPGTEECDEEGGWRSEGHHGLLSSVVPCAGHWR